MIAKNRQLITNNPFRFEENMLKVKIAGNVLIILEGLIEYTQI